ncbi:protein ALTERED PHOSPHATE STARVATION RESPONSE 1-like [Trifolium pratense]|uniref:protein ALTERED PHOSPHATE STARVATION RESPONSE 1-like n=1 Tax=Trifolium pratense TaxID=57577 RepID=UPI001E69766D|nr:protein ALTERED PHOSPHATE STARVATION RESPONSE 1-like [Trifolium pratense]
MGCNQSKIENEESLLRCKERKRFMKEAVSTRNAFAAAHSAYTTSLKNTGAALGDFAHGEVQNPISTAPDNNYPPRPPENPILPPPPLPDFSHGSLHRAASMPEIKIAKPDPRSNPLHKPILEEEDEDRELEDEGSLRKRRTNRNTGGGVGVGVGVGGGGGGGGGVNSNSNSNRRLDFEDEAPPPMPPPLVKQPPVSREHIGNDNHNSHHHTMSNPNPQQNSAAWEYFFPPMENIAGPSLNEEGEEEVTFNRMDRMEYMPRPSRVGIVEEAPTQRRVDLEVPFPIHEPQHIPEPEEMIESPMESPMLSGMKVKMPVTPPSTEGKRIVKHNANLVEIFAILDDHFLKASESAHEVSKMLEATRLHYHSNFADNRGHIDHSARVMRVITWNRSFKGIPNLDDGKDDFDSDEQETHATILDKLLAWEKKLYDEVKAGELMKFEYQRKVATLNRLKKRANNSESLEKSKAAVSHLHTRYIVDMQSLDSTVSEINRLRDEQLYPRLVQLVDAMATMWKEMLSRHEKQLETVQLLRSLDPSQSPKQTSEHHHERTYQLLVVVQQWHTQFELLVNNQKGYIKSLTNWLKLNLIPIESSLKEKVSSPPRVRSPPLQGLLHAWHDRLEKLPDELAKTAIGNFAAVIDTIFNQQEEEMICKRKCEDTRKELSRKTRQFEDWYHKYMQRKMPEDVDPDKAEDANAPDEVITEKQFLVEQVRKRLEDEEAAYEKQCLQVRQKTLGSLKNRMPELFRAMCDFSLECSKMYMELCYISQHLGQNLS